MYNNRIILYLMLVSLAAFSPIITSAAGQQSSSNSSQGVILELNDSLVNSTISKYQFFALDCYAPWCPPCEEMNAAFNLLSSELDGQIAFGVIDVKNNSRIAKRYNITYLPTLLIFNNGTLIDTRLGYSNESDLVGTLKTFRPGLNTSLVKIVDLQKTTAAAPAANQRDIPLIDLGGDKPAMPMKVNDSTLKFAVKKYPFFVLMGFADWCGYCKAMNSTILELSNELKGQVAFGLINAVKNNETATKYNITFFPVFFIFKNGSLNQTLPGYTEKSKFVEALKKIEPSLDISNVNITATPQPAAAPSETSKPAIAPSKVGTAVVVNETAPEGDAALKYLDRILNYTQTNRTSGTTINIFIINACPQSQGK